MKRLHLKKVLFVIIAVLLITQQGHVLSQTLYRKNIRIPDILGYTTLKCDFHMHTVFSDGTVWPTVRAEEAWHEGLDAFAITDHVEHQAHERDVKVDINRPYEIVRTRAEAMGLICIQGAEITRDMPPGHMNAIFLKDANALMVDDWRDAVKEAINQGAFIFWNHPGAGQPDGVARWYDEHTELVNREWIHGIEVVNGKSYYPKAFQWCIEKQLTLMGNSDVHTPIQLTYDFVRGEHRPMTLVFVKEKNLDGIKGALYSRRTVVYWDKSLIGEEKYLRSIFNKSIKIQNNKLTMKNKRGSMGNLQIFNWSDIDFELVVDSEGEDKFGFNMAVDDIWIPKKLMLYAGKTVEVRLWNGSEQNSSKKNIVIQYRVENLKIFPDQGLAVKFNVEITFVNE